MAKVGPVVMSVVGDTFTQPARISAVLWDAATSSSSDTVELSDRDNGSLLWPGRGGVDMGMVFGHEGLHAPTGFTLTKIASGRLLVYLKEN